MTTTRREALGALLGAGASVASAASHGAAGAKAPAALAGDFLAPRPAIFVAGKGEAAFSRLGFRALTGR
jgi:hypothetical protein